MESELIFPLASICCIPLLLRSPHTIAVMTLTSSRLPNGCPSTFLRSGSLCQCRLSIIPPEVICHFTSGILGPLILLCIDVNVCYNIASRLGCVSSNTKFWSWWIGAVVRLGLRQKQGGIVWGGVFFQLRAGLPRRLLLLLRLDSHFSISFIIGSGRILHPYSLMRCWQSLHSLKTSSCMHMCLQLDVTTNTNMDLLVASLHGFGSLVDLRTKDIWSVASVPILVQLRVQITLISFARRFEVARPHFLSCTYLQGSLPVPAALITVTWRSN